MKRSLVVAMIAVVLTFVVVLPTFAMVGVEKPDDPDKFVITSIKAPEPGEIDPRNVTPVPTTKKLPVEKEPGLERVTEMQPGDKVWYIGAPQTYQIVKGDTLWKIGQRLVNSEEPQEIVKTVADLVKLNQIANPDMIYVGATLKLPMGLV